MKRIKTTIWLLGLFVISCSPTTYFQLFNSEYGALTKERNVLKFENDDIIIEFDFWSKNGSSTFLVHNKKDEILYVDLLRSHLIINNRAQSYFENISSTSSTTIHTSKSSFLSTSLGTSGFDNSMINTSSSTTFYEDKVLIIPPKSSKIIIGYNINTYLYKNCDLRQYPLINDKVEFTKETTPLLFRNYLSYSFKFNEIESIKNVDNEFWIKEISNYSKSYFKEFYYPVDCGKKSLYRSYTYLYKNPENFYIVYARE